MCRGERGGGGGFLDIWMAECVYETFIHSIHIKVKSEKHIHNMATIFFLYDCISFNPYFYSTHGCKLISHIKENKEMVAMMLVLCPSNVPGHTYMGPLFKSPVGSFSTASRRHLRY